jgi:hypothetical protein
MCPNGKTAFETRRETEDRLQFLRDHAPVINGRSFELREVWECDVYRAMKKNAEMKKFFEEMEPKVLKIDTIKLKNYLTIYRGTSIRAMLCLGGSLTHTRWWRYLMRTSRFLRSTS